MEFTCHYLLVPRGTFNIFLHTDLEFPWNSPVIISVVPRGTFNIFLHTDLEFPGIHLPLSPLFHVEHSIFFLILTWSSHGNYLPISPLFHGTFNIFLYTDLEFLWNLPAIISVVPRGTFNYRIMTHNIANTS